MALDTLTCSDLHLRLTDAKGDARSERFRVWDADRFLAARQNDARMANADARAGDKDAKCLARVDIISAEQFARERGERGGHRP